MAKKNGIISDARNLFIRFAKKAGAYSVKINNGELLAIKGRDGRYYWNRNGRPINGDYRYYDPNVSEYRVLGNSSKYYGKTHTMKYSPTTPIETKNLDELKSRFGKENAKNWAAEKKQAIVIPKNDKSITLRTKDRNNFSTLDESLLDSIAINSGRSKTDFFSNLALVLRESSGGNKAPLLGRNDYESDYKIDGDNSKDGSTRLNPRYLTNNHAYYDNGYGDALAGIGKRYPDSFKSGDISLSEDERAAGDKDAILADKAAKDILEKFNKNGGVPGGYHERYSDNIMQDAFIRSSKNPQGYNPGEKGRVGKLNNEVLQLRADKKLQEYYSRRGRWFVDRGANDGQTKSSIQKKKHGGPYGSSSMQFGVDQHQSRWYIKPEYINRLDAIKRDARGHLPDYVKGVDHPSGPTYGKFTNDSVFEINDPSAINYVRPGLDDNGDYKARVIYNNSLVLPAITVTPNGNYVEDEYNNIKFRYRFGGKYKRIAFDFYKDKFNKK